MVRLHLAGVGTLPPILDSTTVRQQKCRDLDTDFAWAAAEQLVDPADYLRAVLPGSTGTGTS